MYLITQNISKQPPMFVVFPEICEQTDRHTHTHTHTDTQYDYHTLPPTLRGEGNKQGYQNRKNTRVRLGW